MEVNNVTKILLASKEVHKVKELYVNLYNVRIEMRNTEIILKSCLEMNNVQKFFWYNVKRYIRLKNFSDIM